MKAHWPDLIKKAARPRLMKFKHATRGTRLHRMKANATIKTTNRPRRGILIKRTRLDRRKTGPTRRNKRSPLKFNGHRPTRKRNKTNRNMTCRKVRINFFLSTTTHRSHLRLDFVFKLSIMRRRTLIKHCRRKRIRLLRGLPRDDFRLRTVTI